MSKNLSASLDAPISRLVWLCEGLVGLHTPALPRHRSMVNAAKSARKFAMSGDYPLALYALDTLMDYAEDGHLTERRAVSRRVDDARRAVNHRLSERQRERNT